MGGAKIFFFSNHELKNPDPDCTDNYMKKQFLTCYLLPFSIIIFTRLFKNQDPKEAGSVLAAGFKIYSYVQNTAGPI